MTSLVLEQPNVSSFDELEPELLRGFRDLVEALQGGRPAIVVLREEDVASQGEPAAAALAHALLGLVRALATEGARQGWIINAVSVDEEIDSSPWLEFLGQSHGLNGALVRLGSRHLGKVPA